MGIEFGSENTRNISEIISKNISEIISKNISEILEISQNNLYFLNRDKFE